VNVGKVSFVPLSVWSSGPTATVPSGRRISTCGLSVSAYLNEPPTDWPTKPWNGNSSTSPLLSIAAETLKVLLTCGSDVSEGAVYLIVTLYAPLEKTT
jgi:hypothetical protein